MFSTSFDVTWFCCCLCTLGMGFLVHIFCCLFIVFLLLFYKHQIPLFFLEFYNIKKKREKKKRWWLTWFDEYWIWEFARKTKCMSAAWSWQPSLFHIVSEWPIYPEDPYIPGGGVVEWLKHWTQGWESAGLNPSVGSNLLRPLLMSQLASLVKVREMKSLLGQQSIQISDLFMVLECRTYKSDRSTDFLCFSS